MSRAASSNMVATGHMFLFKFQCKLIKVKFILNLIYQIKFKLKMQSLSLTGHILNAH